MVVPFIISGIGMGLFFAPMANVILSAVKPQEEGQASGASSAIRELGGVFGVAVLAAVFAREGSYQSPQAFVDGMVPGCAHRRGRGGGRCGGRLRHPAGRAQARDGRAGQRSARHRDVRPRAQPAPAYVTIDD